MVDFTFYLTASVQRACGVGYDKPQVCNFMYMIGFCCDRHHANSSRLHHVPGVSAITHLTCVGTVMMMCVSLLA